MAEPGLIGCVTSGFADTFTNATDPVAIANHIPEIGEGWEVTGTPEPFENITGGEMVIQDGGVRVKAIPNLTQKITTDEVVIQMDVRLQEPFADVCTESAGLNSFAIYLMASLATSISIENTGLAVAGDGDYEVTFLRPGESSVVKTAPLHPLSQTSAQVTLTIRIDSVKLEIEGTTLSGSEFVTYTNDTPWKALFEGTLTLSQEKDMIKDLTSMEGNTIGIKTAFCIGEIDLTPITTYTVNLGETGAGVDVISDFFSGVAGEPVPVETVIPGANDGSAGAPIPNQCPTGYALVGNTCVPITPLPGSSGGSGSGQGPGTGENGPGTPINTGGGQNDNEGPEPGEDSGSITPPPNSYNDPIIFFD